MADALDILTRGLSQASGLSIATRGLLLSADGIASSAAGALAFAEPNLITDIAVAFPSLPANDGVEPDLVVAAGQLVPDHGLLTAVYVSLFTDRLAADDDALPTADGDRRGWWGDAFPPVPGYLIGSRLWLLSREKQTQLTLNRAEEYAREALDWLVEDSVASSVSAFAEWLRRGVMGLSIDIDRPSEQQARLRWAVAWESL